MIIDDPDFDEMRFHDVIVVTKAYESYLMMDLL